MPAPAVTTHQVGGYAYIHEGDRPLRVLVTKTKSVVTYPGNVLTTTVYYQFAEIGEKWFPASEVYAAKAAMDDAFAAAVALLA